MVQNLNNNLITAPELADLRKRLRNLDNRVSPILAFEVPWTYADAKQDGQAFFVTLFRSWCHNAVATFSLCLLAQAYEQAYHLLQIFADLEMTVNILIQIDKLVQLLESPVFTCMYSPVLVSATRLIHIHTNDKMPDLRLQLLEPERFPYLYKCLYGLLMLLPQSSAFAALKNRLNSVSAIGYLHTASTTPVGQSSQLQPRAYAPFNYPLHIHNTFSSVKNSRKSTANIHCASSAPTTSSAVSTFERPNRLKARDESGVRWVELLEKFRTTQERGRRAGRPGQVGDEGGMMPPPVPQKERRALGMAVGEGTALEEQRTGPVGTGRTNGHHHGAAAPVRQGASVPTGSQHQQPQMQQTQKHKGGLGIGRFASGVAGRRSKR